VPDCRGINHADFSIDGRYAIFTCEFSGSLAKIDMVVFLIDGDAFVEIGFITTGTGAHGLYPSRDATKLYVSNRGSHLVCGGRKPHGLTVWPQPGRYSLGHTGNMR
jgi:hypothetical protein